MGLLSTETDARTSANAIFPCFAPATRVIQQQPPFSIPLRNLRHYLVPSSPPVAARRDVHTHTQHSFLRSLSPPNLTSLDPTIFEDQISSVIRKPVLSRLPHFFRRHVFSISFGERLLLCSVVSSLSIPFTVSKSYFILPYTDNSYIFRMIVVSSFYL